LLAARKLKTLGASFKELSIKTAGRKVMTLIVSIRDYGISMMKEKGIKTAEKGSATKSKKVALHSGITRSYEYDSYQEK
jgi:hypothetical protein